MAIGNGCDRQDERPVLSAAETLRRQAQRNEAFVEYLRLARITEMVVDHVMFRKAWEALPHLRVKYAYNFGRFPGIQINETLVRNADDLPRNDPCSSAHVRLAAPREE